MMNQRLLFSDLAQYFYSFLRKLPFIHIFFSPLNISSLSFIYLTIHYFIFWGSRRPLQQQAAGASPSRARMR
jgi:hypothetical protein